VDYAGRRRRLDEALQRLGMDAFVSAAPADLRYLTGSADAAGLLVYVVGRRPTLVMRPAGAWLAEDSVLESDIVALELGGQPETQAVHRLRAARVRRVAWDGLTREALYALAGGLQDVLLQPAPQLSPALRRQKEPAELELLRRAAAVADEAMRAAMATLRPGVLDLEVAAAFEHAARRAGATGPLGATQVKSGVAAQHPDAAASGRAIGPGEVGFVDIALAVDGYAGDLTRAFVIGAPPASQRRILEQVDRIQRMAASMVRPGMACRQIDAEVRRACAEAGYEGNPPHHTGHGLGLGRDLPRVVPTSDDVLQDGDVVTIEPGIYVRRVGGARIEDALLVTPNGGQVLGSAPRVTLVS
jgi:Xaa-Pro aminopeptidase